DGRPHAAQPCPPAAGPEAVSPGSSRSAMNASASPPNQPPGHSPEEIDRLLAAFYSGEVPTPWPALKTPVVSPVRGRGTGLSAGRLALAASVAALLVGGWYVSGRLPIMPMDAGSLDAGKAIVPPELRPGSPP